MSENFSNKTAELLRYIESTYLDGFLDNDNSSKVIDKMKMAELDDDEKKVMDYGFDALFQGKKGK